MGWRKGILWLWTYSFAFSYGKAPGFRYNTYGPLQITIVLRYNGRKKG